MKKGRQPHEKDSKSQDVRPSTGEQPRGKDVPDSVKTAFPVVGIGASAGGLDAYKRFLSAMPADSGMAFILIPHLDPTHESFMVELLAKQTEMAVRQAEDGMPLQPNVVYIIPPNKFLSVSVGLLRLEDLPAPLGIQTAIDHFLRTLATAYGEMAIGIVMSGTGAHGSLGLREISAQGGLTLVQAPETAVYEQMPQNAISSGMVDYILPVERMPEALIGYRRQLLARTQGKSSPATEASEQLEQILTLLQARTRYDFRCYRKKMLMRRIRRRMDLGHLEYLSAYYERLKNDADEVGLLFKDLLINVTSFFRDPDAFKVLDEEVIGSLVKAKASDSPVRVWVPACATGEEAYSIGMLLIETFSRLQQPYSIQIYATDLDEEVLEFARHGVYPESIANDISPARLKLFFTKVGDHHYQVNKQLREVVVFAVQNLVADAPFSKLDLISCRNLLIYLQPDVQRKIVALFHFALKPGSFLFLGPSETIGRQIDLFEVISKKYRIFRRIGPTRHDIVEFPIVSTSMQRRIPTVYIPQETAVRIDFAELARNLLLESYAPAAVLINRRYEILYFQGPTSRYLELPTGRPTRDLTEMAREGLRTKLLATCRKAIRSDEPVTVEETWVNREGINFPVSLSVTPVSKPKAAEGLLLVTFSDVQPADDSGTATGEKESTGVKELPVQQLEHDLKATRDDLQSTIEELESSNEELKASNEEATSMNEELQSVNEELETSKEELQSLNEELSTVNNQLQDKVEELERANNDITNLLENTDIATLFLDTELRVKRFTPAIEKLMPLEADDIGRPLSVFSMNIKDPSLLDDIRRVVESLVPIELEASAPDGRIYLRRIKPYRTHENRIDGVVLTFVDITERAKAFAESKRLAAVLLDSKDAVSMVDLDGRITAWNRGAAQMYGYSESEALQMHAEKLVPEAGKQEFREILARISGGEENESYEYEGRRVTKDGGMLDIWATATMLVDEDGEVVSIAITERDITHRKQSETELLRLNNELEQLIEERTVELRRSEQEFRMLADNVPALFSYIDTDQRFRYVNPRCVAIFSLDQSKMIGRTLLEIQGTQLYESVRPHVEEVLAGKEIHFEMEFPNTDGNHVFHVTYMPDWDEQGQVKGFFVLANDMTDRKKAEKALADEKHRLSTIVNTAADAIITVDREGVIRDFNHAAERIFGYAADVAIGMDFQHIIAPINGELSAFPQRYRLKQESGKRDIHHEVVGHRKDGSSFPIEMAASEIDHLNLFVTILRDITIRKELELEVIEMSTVEQERIGREIHDGIGQQLTALGMLASRLEKRLVRIKNKQEAEAAGQLVVYIQHSLDEVKALSWGLSPIEIGHNGLADALGILVEQARISSEIQCSLSVSGEIPPLDEIVAVHLFRIVQEAINNAIKHAKASRIKVALKSESQDLILSIRDNGRGIDPMQDRKGKLGLHIIRYRAGIIGASLLIESLMEGGTQIKCTLPILKCVESV